MAHFFQVKWNFLVWSLKNKIRRNLDLFVYLSNSRDSHQRAHSRRRTGVFESGPTACASASASARARKKRILIRSSASVALPPVPTSTYITHSTDSMGDRGQPGSNWADPLFLYFDWRALNYWMKTTRPRVPLITTKCSRQEFLGYVFFLLLFLVCLFRLICCCFYFSENFFRSFHEQRGELIE